MRTAAALVSRDGTSLKPGLSKKVVVAAVLGNALEFYDFAAYAFFAVYRPGVLSGIDPFRQLVAFAGRVRRRLHLPPARRRADRRFCRPRRPQAGDAAHPPPDPPGQRGGGAA